MTPEREKWYDLPQVVEMTPREMTKILFEATKMMCEEPNNVVARMYFEQITPVSRDIFLAALVFSVMKNPPVP